MTKKILKYTAAVALLIILIFVFADGEKVWLTLKGANPWWFLVSLLVASGSYLFGALTMQAASRSVRLKLPIRPVLAISLASAIISHLAVGAGAGVFAMRLHLLNRFGVPGAQALAVTGISTAASNLTLSFIIAVGLGFVVAEGSLTAWQGIAAVFVLSILVFVTASALVAMFRKPWRHRVVLWLIKRINRLRRFFAGRFQRGAKAREEARARYRDWESDRFLADMDRSLSLIDKPFRAVLPVMLVAFFDWGLGVACLGFAFVAIGHPIDVGVLVAGYAAGLLASFAAFLPGGLGILEGSMAAAFAHFGVPVEASLSATLLYRANFYVAPTFFCFVFLGPGVRNATQAAVAENKAWHDEQDRRRTGESEASVLDS